MKIITRATCVSAISCIFGLMAWQFIVSYLEISPELLPTPEVILRKAAAVPGYLGHHAWVTSKAAFLGFLIGFITAVILASVSYLSPTAEAALKPYIVMTQSLPKAALAGPMIVWVGYGQESKILVSALFAFFPIFENFLHGLRSTPLELIELFRALGATRWEALRRLRIPCAMPFLAGSCRMAAIYALLGAITTELIFANEGLGYVLGLSEGARQAPLLFSGLGVTALLGAGFIGVAKLIEVVVARKFHTSRGAHV